LGWSFAELRLGGSFSRRIQIKSVSRVAARRRTQSDLTILQRSGTSSALLLLHTHAPPARRSCELRVGDRR